MLKFCLFFILYFFIACGCADLIEQPQDDTDSSQRELESDLRDKKREPVLKEDERKNGTNAPDDETVSTSDPSANADWEVGDSILLSEEGNKNNFNDWLNTSSGSDKISEFGIFNSGRNELILKTDITLSFSSFASEKPLIIRTHGHKLFLAGHSFANLFVETSSSAGPSGDVVIFATGSDLPTLRSEGHDGPDGKSAPCEFSDHPCVAVEDTTTRRPPKPPTFAWDTEVVGHNYSWNDSFLNQQWKDTIRSRALFMDKDTIRSDLCGTDEFVQLNFSEPQIEGVVALQQMIKYPVEKSDEPLTADHDAVLLTGTPGEAGQNAGSVWIFQLGSTNRTTESVVMGGRGGRGGRHLKYPPTMPSTQEVIESKVIAEQLELSALDARMIVSGFCGGEIGRRPKNVYKEYVGTFSQKTIAITTNLELRRRSIQLMAQSAGRDIDTSLPSMNRSGADGRNGTYRHLLISDWEKWRKSIPSSLPIPQESRDQSIRAESSGRLSDEVFGLNTFPL